MKKNQHLYHFNYNYILLYGMLKPGNKGSRAGIVYDDYAQGVNACCSVHQIDGTNDTLLQSFSKRLEYSDGAEEFTYAYMIDDRNVSEEQYEEACLQ